jgi:hypothetical protein
MRRTPTARRRGAPTLEVGGRALVEEGDATVTVVDGFTVVLLPLKFERQAASCRAVSGLAGRIRS